MEQPSSAGVETARLFDIQSWRNFRHDPGEMVMGNDDGYIVEVALPIEQTDEQLLAQALTGNEDAFTALYRRRQGPVYRFALHMSGSVQIAEEVTQEVFLFLLQRGRDFDPKRGTLPGYLFGVARNYVRRAVEKSASEARTTSPAEDDDPFLVTDFDPVREIARSQTSKAVWKAVLSLPEHYREVVVLCDLQELSYADAAQALGCALGTVRSRLHRAHEVLVRKLQRSAPALARFSGDAARCVS
jgi:RNA polymerase sigma-70 factor (ECF subfamily)